MAPAFVVVLLMFFQLFVVALGSVLLFLLWLFVKVGTLYLLDVLFLQMFVRAEFLFLPVRHVTSPQVAVVLKVQSFLWLPME